MRVKWIALFAAAAFVLSAALSTWSASAQDSSSAVKSITLYVDRKTKQVFLEPGRNRIPMKVLGEVDANALADQVEQRVSNKTHQEVVNAVAQTQAQQAAEQHALEQQVASMKPAWQSYVTNFQDKF